MCKLKRQQSFQQTARLVNQRAQLFIIYITQFTLLLITHYVKTYVFLIDTLMQIISYER